MQKKFIQNLILLLALNLLVKPFWILGIDRAVQHEVGTEVYGLYFAIFNFSFLLNIWLDFGITNFNNRNIAQNNQLINKHFSSILTLKLLLGIVFMIFTLTAGFIVGYSSYQLYLLAIMGFNQFLAFMILYMRSNLAGLHLFKTDSLISVLDRSLMIIFCSILLWGGLTDGPFKIEWFIYTQTFSYILTTAITFLIVMRKAHFKKLRWNRPFSMLVLKKSLPFAILVLLMTFYNRIDTVMLERMLDQGATESGIYAAAYRLLDSANMISFLVSGLLLPMFSRMIKFREPIVQLVKLAFLLLIIPALLIAFACHIYSFEIMSLLYFEHVNESSRVFSILMGCFVATSISYVFGTLLTANGNLWHLNLMASCGMLFNILANLWLIPSFQATGAAFSSLSTQFLTAILQLILAQHIFKFKINYLLIFKVLLFIPVTFSIGVYLHSTSMHWISSLFLFFVSGGLIAIFSKLIDFRAMFRILKQT